MSAFDHSHRGFSIANLGRRLEALPALLILVPFVVGIVLHDSVVLHWGLMSLLFVASLACALMFQRRGVAPLFVCVTTICFGYIMAELRRVDNDIPYDSDLELVIEVESLPIEHHDYNTSEGVVTLWRDAETWHRSDGKVMLWLRSDSISEGDRVQMYGRVRERISRFEPYDELLRRRGFIGGVGIDSSSIIGVEQAGLTLHARATRHLERYMHDSAAYATAEAMVVGSRRMISDPMREAYSRTGLAHLMAVSGLHLGVVLLVVGWLLRPLVVVHRGLVPYRLLIIVALWVYAVMSGASASVLRAALMFSVLQLSELISRNNSSLNTLAAVVVAMLIYRPDYLYDISFQLSVVAVAGIVLWGVPLMSYLRSVRRPMWWLLSTVIISVVATLWTMPVVSHTFGAIPIVGVVVTPLAMLTAYLILGCGVFALILPQPLAQIFAYVMECSAWLQNVIVERASWWSWASLEYRFSGVELAVIYALFVLITLCAWSVTKKKVVTLSVDDFKS